MGLALTLTALAAGLLGAGGYGWNTIGSRDVYSGEQGRDIRAEAIERAKREGGDVEAVTAFVNSLTDSQLKSLEAQYLEKANNVENLWGLFGGTRRETDVDSLLQDLASTVNNYSQPPAQIKQSDYLSDEKIDARTSEIIDRLGLDGLRDARTASYEAEMADIQDQYRTSRDQLLASQHRQNAELMDTMQSEMSRARRNALEAGASAGIRLADNINIMLSNQNKQAQTSLDTSNQLAQMMINQRAASRQAQSSYDDYMRQDAADRNAARQQATSEAQRAYNTAYADREQDLANWEKSNSNNAVSSYYSNFKNNQSYYNR